MYNYDEICEMLNELSSLITVDVYQKTVAKDVSSEMFKQVNNSSNAIFNYIEGDVFKDKMKSDGNIELYEKVQSNTGDFLRKLIDYAVYERYSSNIMNDLFGQYELEAYFGIQYYMETGDSVGVDELVETIEGKRSIEDLLEDMYLNSELTYDEISGLFCENVEALVEDFLKETY